MLSVAACLVGLAALALVRSPRRVSGQVGCAMLVLSTALLAAGAVEIWLDLTADF